MVTLGAPDRHVPGDNAEDAAFCKMAFGGNDFMACVNAEMPNVSPGSKHPLAEIMPKCTLSTTCGANFADNAEQCTKRCAKYFFGCFLNGQLADDCSGFNSEIIEGFRVQFYEGLVTGWGW